ncbi:hypothetical protein LBMAG53_20020 [Planctomycetota bacterium]|nr:hypothetical protein LBMAG53_20020 [Planctomycetota bacterium]
MAILNFDASTVEPSAGKDPLPAGKYVAAISASEMKPTKSGTGQYLEIEYQVVDGEYKGRKVWSRHNLQHPNATAVQIARGELSAICRAVGVMAPKDSAELHNLPLTVTVKVQKRQDNGELANEVTAWAKKEAASGAPQQHSGGSPAAASGAPATPPWLRR